MMRLYFFSAVAAAGNDDDDDDEDDNDVIKSIKTTINLHICGQCPLDT